MATVPRTTIAAHMGTATVPPLDTVPRMATDPRTRTVPPTVTRIAPAPAMATATTDRPAAHTMTEPTTSAPIMTGRVIVIAITMATREPKPVGCPPLSDRQALAAQPLHGRGRLRPAPWELRETSSRGRLLS